MFQEGLGLLAEPIQSLADGFNNLINGIRDFFEDTIAAIGEVLNYLNPLSEKFILKIAFIPSEGYFEEFAGEIKQSFDNKFAFISGIGDVLKRLFNCVIDTDPKPPEFTVNLPGGKWGRGKVKIIDFSYFAEYRPYILNFIRVLLWVPFLIRLYKRLPNLIYQ